jgi:hypothetical protein
MITGSYERNLGPGEARERERMVKSAVVGKVEACGEDKLEPAHHTRH